MKLIVIRGMGWNKGYGRFRSKFLFAVVEKWILKCFLGPFYDVEINTQAVGMDSWVHSAIKSILRGDPIFESSAWFFVIILKFIFTSIFEI